MTIQELIKTYPNDAELGAAVRKLFNSLDSDRVIYSTSDTFVEGSPIFFKPYIAIEKYYEIITFHYNGEIYVKDSFTDTGNIVFYGVLRNNAKSIIVNSIKRLSDGVTFKPEDTALFPGLGRVEITGILPNGTILHKDISRYTTTVEYEQKQ